MRRMTQFEAIDFLATAFNIAPDSTTDTQVEATIAGVHKFDAMEALEDYLDDLSADIDPASIEMRADSADDSDLDMTVIIIKTGEEA